MTFSYLDIQKSVMISSPAGSGKTEKLARRYIALIRSGVEVDRILAITFTDKAAAEMKQRILRILREEDKRLFSDMLQKMPLMRVSTIHSFCGMLLRRFSFEIALDPHYRIEDSIDARITWERTLYELLLEAGKGETGNALLLESLSEKGFRGLDYLKTTINYLFEKNPFSLDAEIPEYARSSDEIAEELRDWPGAEAAIVHYQSLFSDDGFSKLKRAEKYFLTAGNTPRKRAPGSLKGILDYQSWASKMFQFWSEKGKEEFRLRAERLKAIFLQCFDNYARKKASKGILDFSDLEYITFKLLTENPEWSNILYAFDEKTDHILVDEFQDTNHFQWGIIDKLTEEWRSGLGAKREEGKVPTLFLVGDEKQSVYYFRGANFEIFNRAKKKLEEWLNREFYYEEAAENFRSLPAIIDFTNVVCSKIMRTVRPGESGAENPSPWMTKYSAFQACRIDTENGGKVELILLEDDESATSEIRQREADVIAKRIQGLIDDYRIAERKGKPVSGSRPCRYMDIALLIKKRTHLKRYEEAFRKHGIPFVALKGIGFYQEPEIALLRALTYFLSNPYDDYSLYMLLKSPFFSIDEGSVIRAVNSKGDCLYSKLRNVHSGSARILDLWLLKIHQMPLSEFIEEALSQTKAWELFHDAQKRANVKKFIKLVEDLEADGKSLLKIRDFLERTEARADEPKANVNTEGMDAVRIMTIHGAKGLEFPVVFVPGLDEEFFAKTGDSLIYESAGKLFFKYLPRPAARQMDEDFIIHLEKEYEEQKRLFYVAITRAEQALFLTGQWNEKNKGFLGFIRQGLGLHKTAGRAEDQWNVSVQPEGFSIVSARDIEALYRGRAKPKTSIKASALLKNVPLPIEKQPVWKGVSEAVDIRRQHGKDWLQLGDIIHRLLEDIANAAIPDSDVHIKAQRLFTSRGVAEDQQQRFMSIIERDFMLLREKGLWDEVVLPRKEAYTELPFVLDEGDVIYSGRIDRVIRRNGRYTVYDYKTFPVEDKEIDYLIKSYSSQLRIYRKAVRELFRAKEVRSFIVFTHKGEMREVL